MIPSLIFEGASLTHNDFVEWNNNEMVLLYTLLYTLHIKARWCMCQPRPVLFPCRSPTSGGRCLSTRSAPTSVWRSHESCTRWKSKTRPMRVPPTTATSSPWSVCVPSNIILAFANVKSHKSTWRIHFPDTSFVINPAQKVFAEFCIKGFISANNPAGDIVQTAWFQHCPFSYFIKPICLNLIIPCVVQGPCSSGCIGQASMVLWPLAMTSTVLSSTRICRSPLAASSPSPCLPSSLARPSSTWSVE